MARPVVIWSVLGLSVVATGTAWWLQRENARQLQLELALLRERRSERESLAEANRKLRGEQVSPQELERLRADRAAVTRLRQELTEMEEAAKKMATPGAPKPPPPATPPPVPVPASAWKNAGRATPAASVETALWAAVGGDLDALAATLTLSPGARLRAETLLAGLPPEARAQYPTPEHFVALFTARDIPEDASMALSRTGESKDDETQMRVTLTSRTRATVKNTSLTVRQSSDGWKLEVPEAAVVKYAAQLKAPTASK